MKLFFVAGILVLLVCAPLQAQQVTLESANLATKSLVLSGLFYETAQGRTLLPAQLIGNARVSTRAWRREMRMPDGRNVIARVVPQAQNFVLQLSAQPDTGIVRWGLVIDARDSEYYTGLMERVVDGPQAASWAPGRSE